MPSKRSRVHPNFKTKYRVANWPAYDRSLVERGNITVWLSPDAINRWNAKPSKRRGGQPKFSDLAIETAITLRMLFHLPLRQAEGFLASIFELMNVHLDVPDHTTLSRRAAKLQVKLSTIERSGPIHLVVDSSGLAIVGQGQWAAAKHGKRGMQGWRKLHLGVDQAGVIIAQQLTDSNTDDATTGIRLIRNAHGNVTKVTGDTAYDTRPFYDAVKDKRARAVIPPTRNAKARKPRCPPRDRTIRRADKVGRQQWKKESGYHRQARVENTFFRWKSIIGDRMRARGLDAQIKEATIACNILNRMTALGRPKSIAITD